MTLVAPKRILMEMVLRHCLPIWAIHCQKRRILWVCLTSNDRNPYTWRIYNNHLLPGPHRQYVADRKSSAVLKQITNDKWPQCRRQNQNSLHYKNVMSWISTITTQTEHHGVRGTHRELWYSGVRRNLKCTRQKIDPAAWTTWRLCCKSWGICHHRSLVQILRLGKKSKADKTKWIDTKHRPYFRGIFRLDVANHAYKTQRNGNPMIVWWNWQCHHR